MRKPVRVALAGTTGAVVLTALSIVMPARETTVGVDRTTPSVSPTVSPFPSIGTVPVVTPSPSKTRESPSGAPKNVRQEKTHESVSASPSTSSERVREESRSIAERAKRATSTKTPAPVKPTAKPQPPAEVVTTISGYAWCGAGVTNAQPCIDQGKLTLYYPAGVATLAGHNYMGYDWMDDLPVGRKVKVLSGSLAGTYVVYSHGSAARGSAGGTFPSSGLGAALALQTCTKTGTGFSFLRRI